MHTMRSTPSPRASRGEGWGEGWRRRCRAAMRRALFLGTSVIALVAIGLVIADRTFPPDISRHRDRSAVVVDSDGKLLRAYTTADGKWRLAATSRDVDPRYLEMLRGYEDRRFDGHFGVDPLAIARAGWQLARNLYIVSGASTITMQAARLLNPHARNLAGKLTEMAHAVQLERRYGKDDILSFYLTLAPFGGNVEGVRAASLTWFGKEPKRLTVAEAALLVVLPQSPERLRPDLNAETARKARDKVLRLLAARGVIAPIEAEEALRQPVPQRRHPMPFHAPHLGDQLRAAAPGAEVFATTLDGVLQRQIEDLARREQRWFGDGADVAIVVADSRTRDVRAWLGSGDFFGAHGQVDLARARRSPGSALKPFIYGLAFDEGIAHPETLIEDAPLRYGGYAPRNFDREFQGAVTIRSALQQSLNVPAVATLERVGPARLVAALREAGAVLEFDDAAAVAPSLPVALGGVGVSLADLTMLYAALAGDGRVQRLRLRADAPRALPTRLLGPAAAWQVADILAGLAPPEPWAQARGVGERRIAYKTGTSYGFRDAWAIGFTPAWTVGVWVGNADGTPRPGQYGRTTAAPILFKVFDLLSPRDEARRAAPPDVLRVAGNKHLPPALRVLGGSEPGQGSGPRAPVPPRILFPPDGATIELPRVDAIFDSIALKAEGGSGGLAWIVNGVPLPAESQRRETHWQPDGEGFAKIVVRDTLGRSATARVRLTAAGD
jgi:penicillin-binding protein 1C